MKIHFYQIYLSSWFGGNCRYHPSCSQYAIETMEKYPFFLAIRLILRRLIRCYPFGPQGYDPVRVPLDINKEALK